MLQEHQDRKIEHAKEIKSLDDLHALEIFLKRTEKLPVSVYGGFMNNGTPVIELTTAPTKKEIQTLERLGFIYKPHPEFKSFKGFIIHHAVGAW